MTKEEFYARIDVAGVERSDIEANILYSLLDGQLQTVFLSTVKTRNKVVQLAHDIDVEVSYGTDNTKGGRYVTLTKTGMNQKFEK